MVSNEAGVQIDNERKTSNVPTVGPFFLIFNGMQEASTNLSYRNLNTILSNPNPHIVLLSETRWRDNYYDEITIDIH